MGFLHLCITDAWQLLGLLESGKEGNQRHAICQPPSAKLISFALPRLTKCLTTSLPLRKISQCCRILFIEQRLEVWKYRCLCVEGRRDHQPWKSRRRHHQFLGIAVSSFPSPTVSIAHCVRPHSSSRIAGQGKGIPIPISPPIAPLQALDSLLSQPNVRVEPD